MRTVNCPACGLTTDEASDKWDKLATTGLCPRCGRALQIDTPDLPDTPGIPGNGFQKFRSTNPGLETSDFREVKGWLKFFIIVCRFIIPALFVVELVTVWLVVLTFGGDSFPVVLLGFIEAGRGLIVMKWTQIGRRLRDIQPGVVQEVKTWLMVSLGVSLLLSLGIGSIFFPFIHEAIAIMICYSYFRVSKRVRATYPDWRGVVKGHEDDPIDLIMIPVPSYRAGIKFIVGAVIAKLLGNALANEGMKIARRYFVGDYRGARAAESAENTQASFDFLAATLSVCGIVLLVRAFMLRTKQRKRARNGG